MRVGPGVSASGGEVRLAAAAIRGRPRARRTETVPARTRRRSARPLPAVPGLDGMRGRARPVVTVGRRGGTLLRARSRPVGEVTAAVRRMVADMVATMRRAHGVGLAAVQIGVPLRVLVADPPGGPLALINPRTRRRWGAQVGPEGCLSIPGVVGVVRRAQGVVVEGLTPAGRRVIVRATDLLARVLQHEIDHLNGILFTDRVRSAVRRRRRRVRGARRWGPTARPKTSSARGGIRRKARRRT